MNRFINFTKFFNKFTLFNNYSEYYFINDIKRQRRNFSDEIQKSHDKLYQNQQITIFNKIVSKEIPSDIIYEDCKCLAFNDVSPQAPVHFLIIPKIQISKLEDSEDHHSNLLGYLLHVAGKLGKQKAPNGFRLVINNGPDGCQSIYYLHLHILGGRQLKWPPG